MNQKVKKVILAYSGGLDTSIIIPWLKENYGCEIIAMAGNIGQDDELHGLEQKALRTGASKVAFAAVVERLIERQFTMFDVQVMSPHLATLGCVEIRRSEYLRLVGAAVDQARRFSD